MNNVGHASLHDAHVLILGGSTGIGLATAAAAHAHGARITLVARTPAKLAVAAKALDRARTAVADVANRRSIENVLRQQGRIDHLVIAAGTLSAGRFADTDSDALLAPVRERIAGSIYAIKAALPFMPATGSIVLMSGLLSERPLPSGAAVVSAAVCAVEGLTRALALELKPIRVNAIAPGYIDTPLYDAFGAEARASMLQRVGASLPRGRVGHADEVAEGILLLLGNAYINGEILHIDGGGRLV